MEPAIDEEFFETHPAVLGLLELFDYLPGVIFFAKDGLEVRKAGP